MFSVLRAVNKIAGLFGLRVVRFSANSVYVEHDGIIYGYDSFLNFRYAPWLLDQAFALTYAKAKRNTLVDIHRCYEIYDLVREVSRVEGNLIEVGVWRGGTAAIIASAAKRWKPASKVYLCDTFYGVVKAGCMDSTYKGAEHSDTSAAAVDSFLKELDLDNFEILEGIFPEETAMALPVGKIALCHIDVDVYQSAADIVAWVKPRMPRGAMIVFDDYGFYQCDGITRLVNELREDQGWMFIYNVNGHAILIKMDH
jgi:O-methyltransferase